MSLVVIDIRREDMNKTLMLFFIIACLSAFLATRNGENLVLEVSSKDMDGNGILYAPVEIDTFDSAKNPVRIEFTQVPRRSLVYEVNTLETLLAFGQGAKILSASLNTSGETYERLKEKYPEELEKIAHISTQEISREMAIAYQPDFILGWKSTFSPKRYGSTEWWKARGVNTYIVATSNHVLKHGTIEDECQFLDDMGRIFDVPGTSAALIGEIHAEMDLVGQNTAGKRKQDVMVVEVSKTGIMNYDDGWIVGDMVRHLGGNMQVKSRSVGAEDMLAQDPDVIFVVCFNVRHREESERFFQQVRFNSLKAFQNHRIYMLPFQYMYTPAVNTLNGIRAIKKGLYPEL